jgi:serine/threonine protein kinase
MNHLLESRQEPIPGYRLIERLGRGGYGDVWKVEAPGGFLKAMKFVFGALGEESEAAADQELGALRQLVQIRHPFILSVERCDVVDGQVLITMELADRSLEDRYHECQAEGLPGVPRDELLRYMSEAAEALDLLSQEYRLQHLDIKPTNLFLVRRHVKVGDFGLVRRLEGFDSPIRSGLTPLYAPPESYEGRVSLNSDQYSLALVYYEMLTGKRAIDGLSGRELMYRALVEGPNLELVADPERAALVKALAKRPEDRFSTCSEFINALQAKASATSSQPEIPFDEPAEREQFERIKPKSVTFAMPTAFDGEEPRDPSRRPQRRRRQISAADLVDAPRAEAFPDGTLQPTLIIGLGGFGIRMGEQARAAFEHQFGEACDRLPIAVLNVDVDPTALRTARIRDRGGFGESPLLVTRLRKGAEYRMNWETSKHISSWLDQEQIFRIGPSGDTRGLRSLGRLALVDNYERVAHQIIASLSPLVSGETAEEVRRATGLRYRRSAPIVFIAAGMGGGVGSGMAIDVAYLVRALLERGGFASPNVCLALGAGIDACHDAELQVANQYALANDLTAFGPESEFAFPVKIADLPESLGGPPAKRVILFDAQADHLPEPRDQAVLETFAEFVVQSAAGGHDAFALDGPASPEPFLGVGWFSLTHPHDKVLRAAGCEFAIRVLDRWLEPLDDEETGRRHRFARQFLETHGCEPAKVVDILEHEAAEQAGEPLHAQAARRINNLIEALQDKETMKAPQPLVLEARRELRLLLGGDPVDDQHVYEEPTPFEVVYKKASRVVVERMFKPIRRELELAVETIDRRFEVVRGTWTGFSEALAGLIKRLVESPKTADLERDAYEGAYQLHKHLILGAMPRTYVASVERWVKTKLDYNARQQLIAIYQILKAKIDELGVQIFTAPRKLAVAKQHLQRLRDESLTPEPSLVRQPLFVGGAVTPGEALDRMRVDRTPTDLDRLEDALRREVFSTAGGVWQTCSRDDVPAEAIADSMAAGAATWLLQQSRKLDAAGVFLDRHQSAPENLQTELKSMQEWSAPSFAPKTGSGKKIAEVLTVLLPPSTAGQELASAILESADTGNVKFASHAGTEVHFARTASSSSLGRLAPPWLLKGKRHLESPKYRGAVVIFPQTVDV